MPNTARQMRTDSETFRGQPGPCIACGSTLASHFDKRNRWIGCRAVIDPRIKFFLVPDRRQPDGQRPTVAFKASLAATQERPAHVPSLVTHVRPTTPLHVSRVLYKAKYGLRDPKVKKISSERDREVYTTIARAKRGITRADLLKAEKATDHTGIVDGAVRRLRLKKMIAVVREE